MAKSRNVTQVLAHDEKGRCVFFDVLPPSSNGEHSLLVNYLPFGGLKHHRFFLDQYGANLLINMMVDQCSDRAEWTRAQIWVQNGVHVDDDDCSIGFAWTRSRPKRFWLCLNIEVFLFLPKDIVRAGEMIAALRQRDAMVPKNELTDQTLFHTALKRMLS